MEFKRRYCTLLLKVCCIIIEDKNHNLKNQAFTKRLIIIIGKLYRIIGRMYEIKMLYTFIMLEFPQYVNLNQPVSERKN